MSTDFSIKPVGAPVAAPIVQHVSEAAQQAVATVLPASQSVAAGEPGARASTDSAAVRISISNAAVSNQWSAWATVTRSTDAGGSPLTWAIATRYAMRG